MRLNGTAELILLSTNVSLRIDSQIFYKNRYHSIYSAIGMVLLHRSDKPSRGSLSLFPQKRASKNYVNSYITHQQELLQMTLSAFHKICPRFCFPLFWFITYKVLWTPNRLDIFYSIFQLVFLWNAFGRPTRVVHGGFTWYLNGILEFCICLAMT